MIDQKKTDHKKIVSTSGDIEKKVDKVLSNKGMKTKKKKKKQTSIDVPEGYKLMVNKRTGLTYFKKK